MCGGFLFFAKILVSDNVVQYITEKEGNNMTNYDRIKAMSVEEMAEILLDVRENHFTYCNYCSHQSYYAPHCSSTDFETDCRYAVKEWLNSEVEE